MTKNDFGLSGLEHIMSQLQDISRALSANFQAQEIGASLQQIGQQIMDTFEPIAEAQLQMGDMLKNVSFELQKLAPALLINFRSQIENLFNPALQNFFETFRQLPVHIQSALITMGTHGWYFDLQMPLPFLWELEAALNEGDLKEAELALVDYFRENLQTIEDRISTKFPHRAKLIISAFNAHRRGEYELSIPIFLSQTDGICYEVVNQYLFIRARGDNRPGTAIYVDSIASDAFRHALLSPLSRALPISASRSERDEYFNELNRHQIMHGEALNYGTEINSLKSISLLNYIIQVLPPDDAEDPDGSPTAHP